MRVREGGRGWIMLDIIQSLTEEEGEPASFTVSHMLPSPHTDMNYSKATFYKPVREG